MARAVPIPINGATDVNSPRHNNVWHSEEPVLPPADKRRGPWTKLGIIYNNGRLFSLSGYWREVVGDVDGKIRDNLRAQRKLGKEFDNVWKGKEDEPDYMDAQLDYVWASTDLENESYELERTQTLRLAAHLIAGFTDWPEDFLPYPEMTEEGLDIPDLYPILAWAVSVKTRGEVMQQETDPLPLATGSTVGTSHSNGSADEPA